MTQGPQGNPITPVSGSYGFIPAGGASEPAQAAASPAPAAQAAPAQRASVVDTPEYAEAITQCIQVHPDLNEVMAKFLGIAQAVQKGHDVREALYVLSQTAAQLAGVISVKQQQVGADEDAEAALDEIAGIAEELLEGIQKVILPNAQKEKLLGMAQKILDITDEFSEDDEEGEE